MIYTNDIHGMNDNMNENSGHLKLGTNTQYFE